MIRIRFAILLLFICSNSTVRAEERIDSFHSDVTINADGSMDVTETIEMTVNGNDIHSAFYRGFRLTRLTPFGFREEHPLQNIAMARNGVRQHFTRRDHTNPLGLVTRLSIGGDYAKQPEGRSTYAISYRTDGWLRFHETRDVLEWNVTGVDWRCPIDRTSVTVHLPAEYAKQEIRVDCRVGRSRDGASNWKLLSKSNGVVSLETAHTLESSEGMTISISWPTGDVDRSQPNLVSSNLVPTSFALLAVVATWILLFRHGTGASAENPFADASGAVNLAEKSNGATDGRPAHDHLQESRRSHRITITIVVLCYLPAVLSSANPLSTAGMSVWLGGWTAVFLTVPAAVFFWIWKELFQRRTDQSGDFLLDTIISLVLSAIVIALASPFLVAEWYGVYILAHQSNMWVALSWVAIVEMVMISMVQPESNPALQPPTPNVSLPTQSNRTLASGG